ncbi:MAG: DUF3369 domain-containing protein, partial [Gammaproteobacteria bacterium]|nr:DUF3369 domain-containing protein [Gammaproteobacteria bacterium]
TELTAQRLYTLVRSALKSYRDLKTIDLNRIGLAHILEATDDLYSMKTDSICKFFQGVLTQIIGLFRLGDSGMMITIEGMITTVEEGKTTIRAGTGEFSGDRSNPERILEINQICADWILNHTPLTGLRKDCMVLPMEIKLRPVGFVYLENTKGLTRDEQDLIQVMVNQSVGALDNLRLHLELRESYERAINTLALAA